MLMVPLCMVSLTAASAADHLAPSALPPAGLQPAQVPQFVLLGFDDNPVGERVDWVVNHLDPKRNPAGAGQAATFDGAPVRMIFFSNGRHWKDAATVAAHQRALAAGHEIANHTQNHEHGRQFTVEQWTKEMTTCDDTFAADGIPVKSLVGFRTPFLEYNAQTFVALAAGGRLYDSSIEEGAEPSQDGTNFFWTYTLDDGSPGNAASFDAGDTRRVGRHPGLSPIFGLQLREGDPEPFVPVTGPAGAGGQRINTGPQATKMPERVKAD